MNPHSSTIKFTFFGSSSFSVFVLDELEKNGFKPICIVTTPDKPQGRKLILTPNPVKEWARERNIPVLDPAKLDEKFIEEVKKQNSDLFIVASYGKIIPEEVIEIPKHKTINIHPSLLPIYRGASPLPTAMLDDAKDTGVSIMRIDEEMDHGPVIAQKPIHVNEWPTYEEFEEFMAREGARLLAETMPKWVNGEITEREQDHSKATYTKKISKEDGLIELSADPYLNFRKIQAYHEWPKAYFMQEAGRSGSEEPSGSKRSREKGEGRKQMRVKITRASFKDGKLVIEKVIPEGKKEMSWKDFESGYLK